MMGPGQGARVVEVEVGDEEQVDLLAVDEVHKGQRVQPRHPRVNAAVQLQPHPLHHTSSTMGKGKGSTRIRFPLNWSMWQERPTSWPAPLQHPSSNPFSSLSEQPYRGLKISWSDSSSPTDLDILAAAFLQRIEVKIRREEEAKRIQVEVPARGLRSGCVRAEGTPFSRPFNFDNCTVGNEILWRVAQTGDGLGWGWVSWSW